jgi:hypothetical protein
VALNYSHRMRRLRDCLCKSGEACSSFVLSNKMTRFSPPRWAAERAWSAEMTPITRLLKQKTRLCKRAIERTLDVNEGYLVVHNVMAKALSRLSGEDYDLEPALASALDIHAKRMQAAL